MLNAGDQTPDAFEKMKGLITACNKNNHYHLHLIKQSKICEMHPEIARELLGILFYDEYDNNLKKCLKTQELIKT